MAITATFQADFTSWKTAVDAAHTQLRGFQTGASQVENSLKRVADSFSGRKILSEASLAVKAIGDMGGVAKLTETEQRRLNTTLTEALAKYRALGQTAPKAMTDLEAATRRIGPATASWAGSLTQVNSLLGAFGVSLSVGALVGFGRELLRTGDELVKVADRTGLTTEEVQKLQFIAGQSGNSIDDMTGAISRLQKGLVGGDKNVVAAVANLGLNFEQLKTASPYEQMSQVAEAMSKIENPAERAKIAIDLFGRAGAEILPTLIANFKQLGDSAPVMSDRTARGLDRIGDAFARAGATMKVWAAESYVTVVRGFQVLIKWLDQAEAAMLNAVAATIEMIAKLPGGAAALNLLGVSAAGVRREALWFSDAAKAMQFDLDRVDVAVRKVVPIMGDYEKVTTGAGRASRTATDASAGLAATAAKQAAAWAEATAAIEKNMLSVRRWAVETAAARQEAIAFMTAARQLESLPSLDDLLFPNAMLPDGADTSIGQWGEQAAVSFGDSMMSTLQGSLGGLNRIFQSAFEGGGNLAGAVKSFSTNVLSGLLSMVPGVGPILAQFSGAIVAGLEKIGPKLLSGFKKIGGFFKRIFGFGGGDDDAVKLPTIPAWAGGQHMPKSFAFGGFVAPGVVMPAILHGGSFGEDITPRKSSGAATAGTTVITNNYLTFNLQALDTAGVKDLFASKIMPEFKLALLTNQAGLVSKLQAVVG